MTPLHFALIERFGESQIIEVPVQDCETPLLLIHVDSSSSLRILMTNGLSEYKMPVPEKLTGREFNELYFCLPSYWDLEEKDNTNMNWVYTWLQKMAQFVVEKNTWFGPGHTIPSGPDKQPLSSTMKQNNFFLTDPIQLEEEMKPLQLGNCTIHFLAIMPIFQDEMEYKHAGGSFKFLQKLNAVGVTEKLDDFRSTIMRSKWRLFKRS